MEEMDKYRANLQKKWDRRYTRRTDGGRRSLDYKAPTFWTAEFILQMSLIILSGFALILLL